LVDPLVGSQQIAQDLAIHIRDIVADVVANILHAAHTFTRITVDCVPPTTNIPNILVDIPISIQGRVTAGEVLPPTATFTFRLLRSQSGKRNGYKRFSGVSEINQNGGVIVATSPSTPITGGANVARLEAVNAALVEPLYGNTVPTGDDVKPVIYSTTYMNQPLPTPEIQFVSFSQLRLEVGSQRTRRK
jgi:hypothetical protein